MPANYRPQTSLMALRPCDEGGPIAVSPFYTPLIPTSLLILLVEPRQFHGEFGAERSVSVFE